MKSKRPWSDYKVSVSGWMFARIKASADRLGIPMSQLVDQATMSLGGKVKP